VDFAAGFAIGLPASAFIVTVGQIYLSNKKRNNSSIMSKGDVDRIRNEISEKLSTEEHERLCASRLNAIHSETEAIRTIVDNAISVIKETVREGMKQQREGL